MMEPREGRSPDLDNFLSRAPDDAGAVIEDKGESLEASKEAGAR
jgi:hypothetical protein